MAQPNHENHPDEHIGHQATGQIVAVDGDGTVPEQRGQRPGIGTGDSGEMHKSGQTAVTPVCDGLVKKVGDENDLSTPEVVASPQQDPGKGEQVVQDEVGGYVGGGSHQGRVLGEQVPYIAQLGKQQEDPRQN